MSIVIDLIIVGIILLCVVLGYRKGLTGSLLKIISFVLALVISLVLFKPISAIIINTTNWDENLEQSIQNMIERSKAEHNHIQRNDNLDKNNETTNNLPIVITNHVNKMVKNAGSETKEVIINTMSRNIAVIIINIVVLISLFIICRIILFFIKGIAKLITKIPVIKQFDKLGGILYGTIEALIILYFLFLIIAFMNPLLSGTEIITAIQKSFLGNMMYNNNLLLMIFF